MGKSAPSAPAAPDPVATAQAQTTSNVETARTNAALNRVNQVGPDGSITYTKNNPGNPSFDQWYSDRMAPVKAGAEYQNAAAANGAGWEAQWDAAQKAQAQSAYNSAYPNNDSYTMTTSLSPEQQHIYDQTQAGRGIYADTAVNQLQGVQQQLSTPFSNPYAQYGNQAAETASSALARANTLSAQPINTDYNGIRDQSIEAAMSRLNPQFAQEDEGLRSRLAASGISAGSEAWDNAYRPFNQEKNDARMQAILQGGDLANQSIQQTGMLRGIPLSELGQVGSMAGNLSNLAGAGLQQSIATRTQPLNETAALLSGQQVNVPQLQGVPQTQVAPTDVLGAYGMNQAGKNTAYQGQLQAYNNNISGMYGVGSAALAAGAIAI